MAILLDRRFGDGRCGEERSAAWRWRAPLIASLIVVPAMAVVAARPTAAQTQTITWDFDVESQAEQWTATNTYKTPPVPQVPIWTWASGSGSTPGMWRVESLGVSSPAVEFGNYLTSQLIQLGQLPADKFTFSMAHRFRMPTDGFVVGGVQLPVVAGQFEYSLDGATYLPVFSASWTSSGTIPSYLTPFIQSSTWDTPSFVPGVPPVVSLPPLIDGGASFTGVSAGRDAGWFVASQAFEVDFPGTTQTIQFRFTKTDMATNCGLDAGWDLRLAQVDLVLAPEPNGATLASLGAGAAVAALLAGRRHQRPSSPSDSP
jgi:hypothetical protein